MGVCTSAQRNPALILSEILICKIWRGLLEVVWINQWLLRDLVTSTGYLLFLSLLIKYWYWTLWFPPGLATEQTPCLEGVRGAGHSERHCPHGPGVAVRGGPRAYPPSASTAAGCAQPGGRGDAQAGYHLEEGGKRKVRVKGGTPAARLRFGGALLVEMPPRPLLSDLP